MEELQAKCTALEKSKSFHFLVTKILDILENQIDTKKKQLQQLERLYSQPEDAKTIAHTSCDEDSNSNWVDESTGANGKTVYDALKYFRLVTAKVDAEILNSVGKLGEMLQREQFSSELGSLAAWKSIQVNIELHEIRRELIEAFEHNLIKSEVFGIKRMGKLNEVSFREACRQKYGNDDADDQADMLFSKWAEELKDPSWHPFKIIDADGRLQEVVDGDDRKLKQLRDEYGEAVYNAVTTALIELNQYNPSGRYPVRELWNFREGQKATVKEILSYILRPPPKPAVWRRVRRA